MTKDKYKNLPKSPGVYIFKDSKNRIIYVGKSVSLKNRVGSYFSNKHLGPKTKSMVSRIEKIDHIKVFSEFEALLLEAELIKKYQPFFNIQAKDDKSPIYIKITKGEMPQITTTRREKPQKGDFIKGPFPSAKTTRQVLRQIRRIFPYCHHKNPTRPCLYVDLGLCPYPYKDENTRINYTKNINKIKNLLSGKSALVLRSLTREMNIASKNQNYEEAQIAKEKIEKIQYILSTFRDPREYMESPTLVDDLTNKRLEDLKEKLKLKSIPVRIECYDISNIKGKMATGSMVVFVNGQPEKGQYRKFKIKFIERIDDYEMIREILSRRLKNKWKKPDLIIIDGGRGQLNAALSALTKYKQIIPVISLAKRFEEIYIPQRVLPISLPKESPARQLVQSLRDEAHRFAITYHRLLRSKELLPSSIKTLANIK